MTRASLGYRKHLNEVRRGLLPDKYARILPFVTGKRVLEIGSAEGVLSLALAKTKWVIGVEADEGRFEEAERLQNRWRALGHEVDRCEFVHNDIRHCLHLLQDVDTVVAVRSIYYLREHIPAVFACIADHVGEVVLCGNPGRWRYMDVPERLGAFNRFASLEGMRGLLGGFGYRIAAEVKEGDPIVVGRRDSGAAAHHHVEGIA